MKQDSVQTTDYHSPLWCRNQHIQSLLATFKLRRNNLKRRAKTLIENTQEQIVHCGDGVRLQSFYSPQSDPKAPLAVLIHGWEGSHESLYLLSTANTLYTQGFNVIRLNLRDHGNSHHLNPELFHSNRIEEVIKAVKKIQDHYQPTSMVLCGFSLGGNFALRVANAAASHNIHIAKTLAICPALDPADILIKLETTLPVYMKYFMLKWKRSIRKKQELFPDLYDLESDLQTDSMRELTEKLVRFYGDYETINAYFDGYNICHERLDTINSPATILVSKDDPIIDYQGIYNLSSNPNIKKLMTHHGGHCGYIKNVRLESWLDDFIVQEFTCIKKAA